MENCFNEMLEYGEAIKSSFVKGYVSDWPEEVDETPETPETEESGATPESVGTDDVEPEADPEETPETEE